MAIPPTVFTDGTVPIVPYEELRDQIQDGDLLLCSGSATFSKLIQMATHSIWSHVGFVMRLQSIDRVLVLESVESMGVRAVPLRNYVRDYSGSGIGYPGRLLIARHAKFPAGVLNQQFAQFAVDLLGYPYHQDEIAQIAFHLATGGMAFESQFAEAKRFICSEYAYACYEKLGVSIRRGDRHFIAPADFANDTNVRGLAVLTSSGTPRDM